MSSTGTILCECTEVYNILNQVGLVGFLYNYACLNLRLLQCIAAENAVFL